MKCCDRCGERIGATKEGDQLALAIKMTFDELFAAQDVYYFNLGDPLRKAYRDGERGGFLKAQEVVVKAMRKAGLLIEKRKPRRGKNRLGDNAMRRGE